MLRMQLLPQPSTWATPAPWDLPRVPCTRAPKGTAFLASKAQSQQSPIRRAEDPGWIHLYQVKVTVAENHKGVPGIWPRGGSKQQGDIQRCA